MSFDVYKESMENRYGQIFEYKVQYRWPEKCRTDGNASNHVFTSLGYYKSIGEFLMWNAEFSQKWADFKLLIETERERDTIRDDYLKEKYYNLVENNSTIALEESLNSHLMSISMCS